MVSTFATAAPEHVSQTIEFIAAFFAVVRPSFQTIVRFVVSTFAATAPEHIAKTVEFITAFAAVERTIFMSSVCLMVPAFATTAPEHVSELRELFTALLAEIRHCLASLVVSCSQAALAALLMFTKKKRSVKQNLHRSAFFG